MLTPGRQSSFNLGEFRVNGHLILVLATLTFPASVSEDAPIGLDVRIVVDGNIDDDIYFGLDWAHLLPSSTVDEGTQLQNELDEDLLSPRALNIGS